MHEEAKLKVLQSTAPFESFNTPEDKSEWLDQYKENIAQAYERQMGMKPVSCKFAESEKKTTLTFNSLFSCEAAKEEHRASGDAG